MIFAFWCLFQQSAIIAYIRLFVLYFLCVLVIASSCRQGAVQWACSVASCVFVCIYMCVSEWREAAMLLWMLISSGLWWCHALWCHTRRGWTKMRGGQDGQTKELHKCTTLLIPLKLPRSHACPGHRPHLKLKTFIYLFIFHCTCKMHWALTIAHQHSYLWLSWQQPRTQPASLQQHTRSHTHTHTHYVSLTEPLHYVCILQTFIYQHSTYKFINEAKIEILKRDNKMERNWKNNLQLIYCECHDLWKSSRVLEL